MISVSRMVYGLIAFIFLLGTGIGGMHIEKRNKIQPPQSLTIRNNHAFYERHNASYRFSIVVHYAQAKANDVLERTPLSQAASYDAQTDADFLFHTFNPPLSEPETMYFGPLSVLANGSLYHAVDWARFHHEEMFNILAAPQIPWNQKEEYTSRAVRYYLKTNNGARSPAPLDITLRRAGVLMKPYFTYFRNYYPETNNYFFVTYWWHPVIYEAMMIGGNDDEQVQAVRDTHNLYPAVMQDRPLRMLLSREAMPRYSRMSPESANIFDNLHMLQNIAFDIMAYEEWSLTEKRKELSRVLEAMSYQRGDENQARKFEIPHPDMDPRLYSDWMKRVDGSMNRIMLEMMQEMWPYLMPDNPEIPDYVIQQMWMKLIPGMQKGEMPGSLCDALLKLTPEIKLEPDGMKPGKTCSLTVQAMRKEWQHKYGNQPDIEPLNMDTDPSLPFIPQSREIPIVRIEQVAAADRP